MSEGSHYQQYCHYQPNACLSGLLPEEGNSGWLHTSLGFGCLCSGPGQLSWDSAGAPWGAGGGHGHGQPWSWGAACELRLHCPSPARAAATAVSRPAASPDPGADHTRGPTSMLAGIRRPRQNQRHRFPCRKMKLLVQPASSFYAAGGCFGELPGAESKKCTHECIFHRNIRAPCH